MIDIKNINKIYNPKKENEVIALNNVSLSLQKGDWLMVVGTNGSGKSTLLNSIAGTTKIDSGTIKINSVEVQDLPTHKRSMYVSRLFQNPILGTAPELSILENFRLASLHTKPKTFKLGINTAFENKVKEIVSTLNLGLENKLNQAIGSLSGGQRQALTLLMTTMDNVSVLLMDEPTAALDPKTAQLILNTTQKLVVDQKITVVYITHQLKEVLNYGNKILFMEEGKTKFFVDETEKKNFTIEQLSKWFA
jgi:putative tryptophan/tyrosine transport system ATP-binding protein